MRTVLPCLGMLIADVMLIYQLRQIRGERWSKRETAFTRSVVALNTLYIVSQIPTICTWVFDKMFFYRDYAQITKGHVIAEFVFVVGLLVTSLTYVFPTVVNFLFNRLFRQEIFVILTSIRSATKSMCKFVLGHSIHDNK